MFSDRQFVVIGVAMALIYLFVMTMWHLPWLSANVPALCSGDCTVQGWLSALSGWAAGFAAAATVWAINRQIREANRYQRENLELQIASRLTLARRVSLVCITMRRGLAYVAGEPDGFRPSPSVLREQLREATISLDRNMLQAFEIECGLRQTFAVNRLFGQLENAETVLSEGSQEDIGIARDCIQEAEHSLAEIEAAATMFIRRWEMRIRDT